MKPLSDRCFSKVLKPERLVVEDESGDEQVRWNIYLYIYI